MNAAWTAWIDGIPEPVIQFVKYALCGGFATAVDIAVFFTMAWVVLPALREDDPLARWIGGRIRPVDERRRPTRFLVNTLAAFAVSNLVAYVLNVAWVFEPGRHSRWMEIALFLSVSGVSVGVGAAVGWALIRWLRWSTTFSYAARILSALLLNFAGRKWFVFQG
jgi:putative flippase GtrA